MGDTGLLGKVKQVITKPSEFFEQVKSEQGIKNAFVYLAVLSIIGTVASIALMWLGYLTLPATYSQLFTKTMMIFVYVAIYIAALGLSFLGIGLIHVFARMLGGQGDYAATYKSIAYGGTPSYLLGWVPYVGILSNIYSLYLSIKGVSKLHNVSMGRAFVIVFVVPLAIAIAVSVVFTSILYMYLFAVFSAAAR